MSDKNEALSVAKAKDSPDKGDNQKSTGQAQPPQSDNGLASRQAGPLASILLTLYLVLFTLLLVYGLIQFWPVANQSKVTFFVWNFELSQEVRMILLVAMGGAVGGLVHALRSLSWYIGNRGLVMSWFTYYFLRPFVGATLGMVFYFVLRAGFFSPNATVADTSPYGFVALSGLVGMFSEPSVLKLKEVAETMLTRPEKGEDAHPQEE